MFYVSVTYHIRSLIWITSLNGRYYYRHFREEEIETQKYQ